MRLNVYAQEITDEVEMVVKNGHSGLRIYLASASELHHTADDDDRSAVTFWGGKRIEGMLVHALAVLRSGLNGEPRGRPRG